MTRTNREMVQIFLIFSLSSFFYCIFQIENQLQVQPICFLVSTIRTQLSIQSWESTHTTVGLKLLQCHGAMMSTCIW
ncbi:hypothetical protein V6Z11_D06G079500 [Gossypium hirsutum]